MSERKENLKTEDILHAMEIYLNEYIHRDTHMWSQTYKFFFSSLVVMLLPYLTGRIGIQIPEKFTLYTKIFPVAGIVLAFAFLYVSLSLAKRFNAVSRTYNKLINQLPEELKRVSINELPCKFLNRSLSNILLICMFLVLLILGIILLVI